MTCLDNLIDIKQCLGVCSNESNELDSDAKLVGRNSLLSSIFSSWGDLLYCFLPLDKEEFGCILLISPKLYYFQGKNDNAILGCMIIANETHYISFHLNRTMFTLNAYHMSGSIGYSCELMFLEAIRVPCFSDINSTQTWMYLEGRLRLKLLTPCHSVSHENRDNAKENLASAEKQCIRRGCFDIVCNYRGKKAGLQGKGRLALKNPENTMVLAAFMSKQYIEVEGFHGHFDWITVNVKPKNADTHP